MADDRKYSTQQVDNLSLGQMGSILVGGTTAVTTLVGVFVQIQFLEDTVFDSGATGLIPETAQRFPSSDGAGTDIDADGGAPTDTVTFPQGMTIFGRWTGFKLSSGKVIAYVG
tara:strand:- start:348 stop:686 length:339 start_codon:yes stop_codon:yes gene_type:complete